MENPGPRVTGKPTAIMPEIPVRPSGIRVTGKPGCISGSNTHRRPRCRKIPLIEREPDAHQKIFRGGSELQ